MGVIQGIAETVSGFKSPGEILQDVNRALVKRFGKGKTVSLVYADFVLSGKKVIYSAAAMPSPILVRNGVPQNLDALEKTQPLGKTLTAEFTEKTIDLQFGDILIFLSDGIPAAQNTNGEPYDNQRLRAALTGVNGGLTAREIRDLIFADVLSFVGNAEYQDDMTAVVVKVT
jgi:sigma-B regulation protein RsbU (phosphoserine phosphatase)